MILQICSIGFNVGVVWAAVPQWASGGSGLRAPDIWYSKT